jgi:hypothetical protein
MERRSWRSLCLKAASKPVSASATNPDPETAGSRLRSACRAHTAIGSVPTTRARARRLCLRWSLVDARGKKGLADRALRSRLISLGFDIFSRPTNTASARNANDGQCREIVDPSSRNLGSRQNKPDPAPIDNRTRFKPWEAGGLADWMRATRMSPTGWGSGGLGRSAHCNALAARDREMRGLGLQSVSKSVIPPLRGK